MDVGDSLNPAIDLGQIQGAYMMSVGNILRERQAYDDAAGVESSNTFNYKPPSACDVPRSFNVQFYKGLPNSGGTFGSKAVGEPPFMLGISAWLALSNAVAGYGEDYPHLNAPATAEEVWRAARKVRDGI